MTQYEELQANMKRYQKLQFEYIVDVTRLIPPLVRQCLEYSSSYPDLKLQTVGKEAEWLNFERLLKENFHFLYDLQLQCMMCRNFFGRDDPVYNIHPCQRYEDMKGDGDVLCNCGACGAIITNSSCFLHCEICGVIQVKEGDFTSFPCLQNVDKHRLDPTRIK